MDTLIFRAVDRRGAFSPACRIMISTDGGETFTAAQQAADGQSYANVSFAEIGRLAVYAVPDDPIYWPASAVFESLSDGSVVAKEALREFFSIMGTMRSGRDTVTIVHVHLSMFRDTTGRLLDKLRHPPEDRWASAYDEPTWGTSWISSDPGPYPIVTEQVLVGDAVLFTERKGRPAFDVHILERKGEAVIPKYFVVAWPNALPRDRRAAPTPFLIFFTHQLNQNLGQLSYLKQYPDGWDYLTVPIYDYLNFIDSPLDLSTNGFLTRGLLPQIAASGKTVALVIPVGNALHAQAEVGDALDAAQMEVFLLEIQSFFLKQAGLFRSPNPYIGRVAMAAFSSGNNQVPMFLNRQRNTSHRFCRDTLREVYCFDTPSRFVTGWAGSALKWASDGKNHTDKMIRMYGTNPGAYDSVHQAFMGTHAPRVSPYVSTRADRTVAVLPEDSFARAAVGLDKLDHTNKAQVVHQLICASMLTDALRRSGF